MPESAGPWPAYTDRDDVHDIYRAWRAVADEYPDRVLIGEIWLPDTARLARYLRPDELHTAFNFPYLSCPWDAAELRAVIDDTLALHAAAGAPAHLGAVQPRRGPARVQVRPIRHLVRPATGAGSTSQPVDLALGTRRARAAALLTLALPGSAYLYQGEELGLWEVEDIPDELRQDPIWQRTGGADPRPGRLPGAAALVGDGAAVRLLAPAAQPRALAAAAQGVARADRRGRDRRARTPCSRSTAARCASAGPTSAFGDAR